MAESDDLRIFIRDLMTRFDKRTDAWERGIAAQIAERERADIRRHREVMAELEQIAAEGRAGRQALFHLLDRLNGQGGPEPA